MTKQLIECVPNFSEGRDNSIIEAIVKPLHNRKGCAVLDCRADKDHNRLVVSLAGEPYAIQNALIEASIIAVNKIDMEKHRGGHPRVGAIDVIPFTPIKNITIKECVDFAHGFGKRFNEETNIPVYFYEDAALKPERKNLEVIRKGQYEVLKTEIIIPERHPDIGEPLLHPTAGATIIGARKFLIAFNVNLDTNNIDIANEIAKILRSSSGGLSFVKGIGVALKERNLVQVSMNIVDYEKNALYRVLELIRMEAKKYGVNVIESEVYGMVPAAALLDSAEYYMQITGFNPNQVLELRLLEMTGEEG